MFAAIMFWSEPVMTAAPPKYTEYTAVHAAILLGIPYLATGLLMTFRMVTAHGGLSIKNENTPDNPETIRTKSLEILLWSHDSNNLSSIDAIKMIIRK